MIWIFGPSDLAIRDFMRDQGILFIRGVVKVYTPGTMRDGLRFDRSVDVVYLLDHTPLWVRDLVAKAAISSDIEVTLAGE